MATVITTTPMGKPLTRSFIKLTDIDENYNRDLLGGSGYLWEVSLHNDTGPATEDLWLKLFDEGESKTPGTDLPDMIIGPFDKDESQAFWSMKIVGGLRLTEGLSVFGASANGKLATAVTDSANAYLVVS